MEIDTKCPNCKSQSIRKDGKRKTENRGLIQRYKCKECGLRFVLDYGFYRMRNSPQKITCALDLFYRGVSTRKVQEHFQAFYPHNSSHKSIYKWIVKYSKKISQYTHNLKLNVGNELQIDEMEYHRRKSRNYKGVDKNWFIDVIDTKTRFMVSSNYVKSRSMNELKDVLKSAKKKTEQQVKIITTDGYMAYPQALRNSFGLHKRDAKTKITHHQVNASQGEGFNIMIERLHNNIRQRTKTFRGFHGSVESANAIMKGYEVYYNFITKHQALNKCPYELATDLKLNSENKWLELIGLSNI
ncbi:MAG: DDE-type integrase/transposase/recombinase [Candidatus Nanoarchaeia archaeon]|nr:DDE-type integrase/transposase/recombinase [Candidatus Nanoarchaeia archaeon]